MQPAIDDIEWEVNREEFEEPLVTKRESAPDPGGLPCAFRCAGGIGTHFVFEAYQHLLHGRHTPEGFAASKNVLIPSRKLWMLMDLCSVPRSSASHAVQL